MPERTSAGAYEQLFHGTVDGVTVHPRVVLESVIEHKATQVVFTHNHPSGIAEPSHADMLLTERLIKALALIEVRVRDHFIVGASVVSFAERADASTGCG